MTQREKINNLRIASGICGFSIPSKELDLLISLYELVMEKNGNTRISDITKVEMECRSRPVEPKNEDENK